MRLLPDKGYKNLIFISGLVVAAIGIFLPYAAGKNVLYAADFAYWNLVNIFVLEIIFLTLTAVMYLTKKINWALAGGVCSLFVTLSVIFMRDQWKPALKSKFFLDFFEAVGPGWLMTFIGVMVMLVMVIRAIPSKTRAPYLFLLPMVSGVFFLTFFPAIFALFISFHKWNILIPRKPFVGFDNFIKAFGDEYFWKSIWVSFKFALGVIPAKIIISFVFALMIYTIPKFKSLFRVIYFLPTVTSVVAVSVIWNWIYHPYYGIANYFLSFFGIKSIDWLGNPSIAIWSVAAVAVWRGVGYDIIIFLAGLNDIPSAVMEAAEIDGASRWQRLKHIIIPLMKPSLVFVFITSTIGAIQVFSEIYMMTGGNADTKTAVYYIWDYGFSRLQMGYASAMSLILFAIILTISLIQMRVTKLLKED